VVTYVVFAKIIFIIIIIIIIRCHHQVVTSFVFALTSVFYDTPIFGKIFKSQYLKRY
jgi:type II secretory pathway component PulF